MTCPQNPPVELTPEREFAYLKYCNEIDKAPPEELRKVAKTVVLQYLIQQQVFNEMVKSGWVEKP